MGNLFRSRKLWAGILAILVVINIVNYWPHKKKTDAFFAGQPRPPGAAGPGEQHPQALGTWLPAVRAVAAQHLGEESPEVQAREDLLRRRPRLVGEDGHGTDFGQHREHLRHAVVGPRVIEEAAIRQTAHVRAYQMGPHAAECTRILNELAAARSTLLNPAKRRAYYQKVLAKRGSKPAPPVAELAPPPPVAQFAPPAPEPEPAPAPRSSSSSSGSSSSGSSSSGSSGGSQGSAPAGVWAQPAQCESGGNPATNTGNGYYGLYQFSLPTWQAMGGSGLPSEASAAEQTQRAQKLQAQSGWGQWPACAAKLGLL